MQTHHKLEDPTRAFVANAQNVLHHAPPSPPPYQPGQRSHSRSRSRSGSKTPPAKPQPSGPFLSEAVIAELHELEETRLPEKFHKYEPVPEAIVMRHHDEVVNTLADPCSDLIFNQYLKQWEQRVFPSEKPSGRVEASVVPLPALLIGAFARCCYWPVCLMSCYWSTQKKTQMWPPGIKSGLQLWTSL